MATKVDVIPMNPSWTKAQQIGFHRVKDALPIALTYLADEIPVTDNHTIEMLIDEVGALKQAKKIVEKAEKAHVEKLKARLGDVDGKKGHVYEATYRGSKRVILNQEACKGIIEAFDEEGVSIKRLLAAIQSGQVTIPENVLNQATGERGDDIHTNHDDFYTTAAGGRSLYVEPIA